MLGISCGGGHFCHLPFLCWMATRPTRPSTRRRNGTAWEAATPWWYQSRRRRGCSCFYWWDSMVVGLLELKMDREIQESYCWNWRKFAFPFFLNPFLGWLELAPSMKLIEEFMKFADPFATMLTRDPGNSGMALLYDVFPRTFWVTFPGPLFLRHNLVWLRTVCEIISSFSVLPWFYMAKLFQANTVNSLEENIMELQKSRLQIEERGLDFVMLLASGSLSKHLLFT